MKDARAWQGYREVQERNELVLAQLAEAGIGQ
jgi:hypothetical protein